MFFLSDGIAVLTPQGVRVMDLGGNPRRRQAVQHISWDPIMAEKGGFKHFMQKEIFEQPRAVRDTLLGKRGPIRPRCSWTRWIFPNRNSAILPISRLLRVARAGTPGNLTQFMIEQPGEDSRRGGLRQ